MISVGTDQTARLHAPWVRNNKVVSVNVSIRFPQDIASLLHPKMSLFILLWSIKQKPPSKAIEKKNIKTQL